MKRTATMSYTNGLPRRNGFEEFELQQLNKRLQPSFKPPSEALKSKSIEATENFILEAPCFTGSTRTLSMTRASQLTNYTTVGLSTQSSPTSVTMTCNSSQTQSTEEATSVSPNQTPNSKPNHHSSLLSLASSLQRTHNKNTARNPKTPRTTIERLHTGSTKQFLTKLTPRFSTRTTTVQLIRTEIDSLISFRGIGGLG
ncbi:hypothetical protein Droror1_Dr00008939 [Drosera rotundifolia]